MGLEHESRVEMRCDLDEPIDVALRIDDQSNALMLEDVCGVSQTGSGDDGDVHAVSEVQRVNRCLSIPAEAAEPERVRDYGHR